MSVTTKPETINPWMHSAAFDVIFISFGWLVLLPFFVLYPQSHLSVLIPLVFIFNFMHRNLVHLLVYGDPLQFKERPLSYVGLPLLVGGLVAVAASWQTDGKGLLAHPLLLTLTILSFIWNFYHTLMQKIGFLRIYSRKMRVGSVGLDRAIIFSWFFMLVFLVPVQPQLKMQLKTANALGRLVITTMEPYAAVFTFFFWLSTLIAIITTTLYIKQEIQGRVWNLAKLTFLFSVLILFNLFSYHFLTAYALFGFSHSIEYLAFVALFCHRKFGSPQAPVSVMKRLMANKGVWLYLIYIALGVGYMLWNFWDSVSLARYYLATSFLHFIYDGWIWKIRKPAVGLSLGLPTSSSLNPQQAP